MTVSSSSGKLEFVDETVNITNYIRVERTHQDTKYEIDADLLKKIRTELSNTDTILAQSALLFMQGVPWYSKQDSAASVLGDMREWNSRSGYYPTEKKKAKPSPDYILNGYGQGRIHLAKMHFIGIDHTFRIPLITVSDSNDNEIYIHQYAADLFGGERSPILLRQLNYNNLHQSPLISHRPRLGEDGSGLISMLFQWHNSNGKLPDRFELALSALFPGWQMSFTVTDGSRILLSVNDGNTVLSPPSIPDGFYKLLAILTAIELNPRFLLIDEIETSLHARMIEYIISELRTCDSSVIVTTHSPAVIDAVQLEDLIMLERSDSGTTCKRVEDPEGLRRDLNELGITTSESWIYGRL